ncbi:MAG: hypothetical protein QM813_02240 [Verrucomicrobiota bacterium]
MHSNPLFLVLSLAVIVSQFTLPRRWAFLPLVIGMLHFQNVAVVQLGVAFTITKLVIVAGLWRAMREGTFAFSRKQPLDMLVVAWAVWMLISGLAHNPRDHNPITVRLSQIYGYVGSYFYARCFLKSPEDFLRFVKALAMVIAPLALVVLFEKLAMTNIYEWLGQGGQEITVRNGRMRATGAFSNPILLGTFGATTSVLMASLYRTDKRWSIIGGLGCLIIVFSSASSGPIVAMASAMMALALWRWRTSVGRIRKLVIATFIILHISMQAPVWYLMARIDLAGGSTGWHRAELITTALNHINEWWLVGTDYTRHWIAYGVAWSTEHIDITNHYLYMGIVGGVPLMLLFIAILLKTFQLLGRAMRSLRLAKSPNELVLWTVGSSIFSHCFTFLSVSYYDQSYVPLCIVIGAVPGLCAAAVLPKKTVVPNQSAPETPGEALPA